MPFYVPCWPRRNLISDPVPKERCSGLLTKYLGTKRRSVWYPARDKVSLWKKWGTQQSNAQPCRSKAQCYCSTSRNLGLPLLPFLNVWWFVKDFFQVGGYIWDRMEHIPQLSFFFFFFGSNYKSNANAWARSGGHQDKQGQKGQGLKYPAYKVVVVFGKSLNLEPQRPNSSTSPKYYCPDWRVLIWRVCKLPSFTDNN